MKARIEDAIEKVMQDFNETRIKEDSIDCILDELINEENSDGQD